MEKSTLLWGQHCHGGDYKNKKDHVKTMIRFLLGIQIGTAVFLQFSRPDATYVPFIVLLHLGAGLFIPIVYYRNSDLRSSGKQPVILSFSFALITGVLLMVLGVSGFGQIILGAHIIGSILFVVFILLQYEVDIVKAMGIVAVIMLILHLHLEPQFPVVIFRQNPSTVPPDAVRPAATRIFMRNGPSLLTGTHLSLILFMRPR